MDNLLDFTTINNDASKNQTKLNDSTVCFVFIKIFAAIVLIFISLSLVTSLPIDIAYGQQQPQQSSSSMNNSGKVVILTFGDTLKGQITTAKPILDKYGFKATFFITCNWVGLQSQKVQG